MTELSHGYQKNSVHINILTSRDLVLQHLWKNIYGKDSIDLVYRIKNKDIFDIVCVYHPVSLNFKIPSPEILFIEIANLRPGPPE